MLRDVSTASRGQAGERPVTIARARYEQLRRLIYEFAKFGVIGVADRPGVKLIPMPRPYWARSMIEIARLFFRSRDLRRTAGSAGDRGLLPASVMPVPVFVLVIGQSPSFSSGGVFVPERAGP